MTMLTPQRALRLMIEVIFVLLGGLVVWLALSGRISVERHKLSWFILSAALILWGLRALYGPNKWWARWENWTRGLSLTLLGVVMLAISRVPFEWVGPLMAAAGILMGLRGIIGAALVFRPR
ncbi:MAG: hypothetical protein WBE13_06860 [Candidatus Acidiferrum sp.]